MVGVSKKVTSVTLDEEIADHFSDDPSKNLSGTVNMLLEQYLSGNGGELAMLELRQQQLESEVEELSGRLDTKREELEQVTRRIREIETNQTDEAVDAATELLDKFDGEVPAADNPAVENHASNVEMDPTAFVELMRDVKQDNA